MRSNAIRLTVPMHPSLAVTRGLAGLCLGLAATGAGAQHPAPGAAQHAPAAAHARHAAAGDIQVGEVFATPTPPGARIGAAYFSARNAGSRDDRLVGAASPAAGRVELHMGEIGADGVMRMRELDAVPVPAGATLQMKPGGGHHLMLMELPKPLVEGESFPMTLEFEHGGKVDIRVQVRSPAPGSAPKHGH
jgi:periplasmic copper chaperone A